MPSPRKEKIAEQLRQYVAKFLEKESNRTSLVTVTRCTVSSDLKQATVYITVLPQDKEKNALAFAKRKRTDLRTYIKKNLPLKHIPFFEIEIDEGEKNRQRIDELLNNA
ncbi:MAG: ribosome-binding factor A [Candidatus Pacebacteria bacterium]|nr:ribosome-binding factor A [Candidatus Paceibacterota bacterium]